MKKVYLNSRTCFFVLCIMIIWIAASCKIQREENTEANLENHDKVQYEENQNSEFNIKEQLEDVEKLEIRYGDEVAFSSIDDNIIDSLISMINESEKYTGEQRLGIRAPRNGILLYRRNKAVKEILYEYDYVYEMGYIDIDGVKLAPDFDFFRYVDDLLRYENHDTIVDDEIKELFNKYDWTVDYRINTLTKTLPDNLKHAAGEFPLKIYWAYNNELSKEIGLDFSKYLGKTIEADIYRLREPLPEFMKPRMNARGIVLRHRDKVIGAYIDAGRHNSFACSLNRKSIEEITDKEWNNWIKEYIDYDNELDIYLSKMEPEEIIEEYFKALDKNNKKMIYACMTRGSLCRYLSTNMDNNKLFNEGFGDNNIKGAKLREIKKKIEGSFVPEGALEYMVIVDFEFKRELTHGDGVQPRFILLKKEVEDFGWRISGMGTGP